MPSSKAPAQALSVTVVPDLVPGQRVPAAVDVIAWPALPTTWIRLLLGSELQITTHSILLSLHAEVPEYRRFLDGPSGLAARGTVERAVRHLFLSLCGCAQDGRRHDDTFRALGRREAHAGRSLESLQSAYRVASLTVWRRLTGLNERMPVPAAVIGQLAAAVFGYTDVVSSLSAVGFRQAMRGRTEHNTRMRARLLQLLIDQPTPPSEAVRELADQVGWQLPDSVVALDVRGCDLVPSGWADLCGPSVLTGTETPTRLVLLPAPMTDATVARVSARLGAGRLAIGCAVPLASARQSMLWAQLAARLRADGVLPDSPVVRCEDELPALLLAGNPLAVDILVRRRLGPLLALSPQKRRKFGRLLATWLERGGSQVDIAEVLGLHRQTAHYQFTRLHELLGADLHDPDARVEMLLALRSVLPAWELSAD